MSAGATGDLVAIERLGARYADVISRRAWDELGEVLAPEAEVHLDVVTAPARTIRGPGDLGAFIAGAIEGFDHFTFVILNNVVETDADDPDRASGRMFTCELRHDATSDTWRNAHGLYQDRYVRWRGPWWFVERYYRSLARTGPGGAVLGLPEGLGPLGA